MQLSDKIKALPHAPGVYLMRDAAGFITYVGKAIDLKKRVGSYFLKTELPHKVTSLIHGVRAIDYIVCASERDALVLENKLIKKYQPRFNVLLRDDKTYPFIMLTLAEDFPRLLLTRQKRRDGNIYFGPYPQVSHVRTLLHWIQRHFRLRLCAREMSAEKPMPAQNYRSCLYLHIGSCPAPCSGAVAKGDYDRVVRSVTLFLQGKHADLIRRWEHEMARAAREQRYEEAASLRDRIFGLQHLYERVRLNAVSELDLMTRIDAGNALSSIKNALALPETPIDIEAFDISHYHGAHPVGSLVTFHNGLPRKSGYRRFHVKTISGINDPAMMREILTRRFSRPDAQPHLVIIDGGKPQLSAAMRVFQRLKRSTRILAALAKREEEIFIPGRPEPIRLPPDSPALLLFRRIRDEAHRFAIAFQHQTHRRHLLPR